MPAVAFSNNDIAVVAWTFDKHLDGCLGFAVIQIDVDANNKETVLPALARFENQDKTPEAHHRTGSDPEILVEGSVRQAWRDLSVSHRADGRHAGGHTDAAARR